MKTVLIAHNFSQVSIASMSYELAYFLARKGMRVVFISHKPYFEGPKKIDVSLGSITVYSWPSKKRPTSFADARWYFKIHKKYKPNIVIGHFVGANITAIISKIASFGQTKTLVYYHTVSGAITADINNNVQKIKRQRSRKKWFYKLFADLIIAPSQLAKDDLKSVFKVLKCIVVPNAVPDRYISEEKQSDTIVISYLGRIAPTKGVLEMVDALNTYQKKVPKSAIRLKIAGNGNQEKELIELCKKNENVSFVGGLAYHKIDSFLRTSHYSIIPSKFDNLPTAGIEALMNHVPLLISSNTGLTKYLSNNKNSFIFTPDVTEMLGLFEKVEANRTNSLMAVEARKVYDNHFSIETYCDTILKQLQ